MPYEEFICKEVLEPAGCYDMHIAGTYYEDRRDNEVRYYTHEGDGKYIEELRDIEAHWIGSKNQRIWEKGECGLWSINTTM